MFILSNFSIQPSSPPSVLIYYMTGEWLSDRREDCVWFCATALSFRRKEAPFFICPQALWFLFYPAWQSGETLSHLFRVDSYFTLPFRTAISMYIPCSVNAYGRYLCPPQLEVKFFTSSFELFTTDASYYSCRSSVQGEFSAPWKMFDIYFGKL